MRTTTPDAIFISHSTPSDNYFVAWLAAKLKVLGYKVWVELEELRSGDAFWPSIEDAIRVSSIKFITVVSSAYMAKIKDPSSGVFKELSCADRIKDIKKFKTPIRIQSINEDDYPVQLMGLNSIDFYPNWQNGLEILLDSFQKEKIPVNNEIADNPLNFWLDAFKIENSVNTKQETIYTNWFPVKFPDKLYIHKPIVANKIDLIDIPYTYLEYSDRHLCFFPKEDYPTTIDCGLSAELEIASIMQQSVVPIDDFLTLQEPRKKLVQLINKSVEDFFKLCRMKHYQQANTTVYYFQNTEKNRGRVSLRKIGKTNVAIAGKSKQNYWSFGISSYCMLYPEPYLKLNSHIIFENSEQVVYEPEEHHALRRKFAFDWYNKDWMDTLLGMTFKLANGNESNEILIPVSSRENLTVNSIPLSLTTNFGYQEPSNNDNDEE